MPRAGSSSRGLAKSSITTASPNPDHLIHIVNLISIRVDDLPLARFNSILKISFLLELIRKGIEFLIETTQFVLAIVLFGFQVIVGV
jgi:hypothetical protein